MSPLSSDERRALLDLARHAILEAVCQGRVADIPPVSGALAQPSGAFVTLHRRGYLCGCIGQVGASSESLAATVLRCAIGAACEDPRFRPVRPEEVDELEIEISVLSELEPIEPEGVEVGRHGLVAARGQRRGVLLPQVPVEHHWTRERFLEETCEKAGLEPDAWKDPSTLLMAFTAEVFSEADFRARHQVQTG
jgi:AmmeMemoRadiSam system protein A